MCDDCLAELFDPADPRYRYPYINCTNCGPRYTVIESLPYDRANTTMKHWPMDGLCAAPIRRSGRPAFPCAADRLSQLRAAVSLEPFATPPIGTAAQLLRDGRIVAIKGIGGYHLACDANERAAVERRASASFAKRNHSR